ncbi:MAG: deoxyribodipyrimidine photo-lyase [Gammaproteobacteria bacterium]|nr:deoxyribodipyrimidine photo-lyase [Gammaproteobacteria bacterium]
MSTALLWLRNDLRLGDNPALAEALSQHERIVPVYVHAPDEAGAWSAGAAGNWWLHHSLEQFDRQLRPLGSRLIIRSGPSPETLQTLARQSRAKAVYWNRRYEPALTASDSVTKKHLRESGLECHSHAAGLLHEPWSVQTASGGPYRVFTAYWRACQRLPAPRLPLPAPEMLPPVDEKLKSLGPNDLGLLPSSPWDTGLRETWEVGENAAYERLETFCREPLAGYGEARDFPHQQGTSFLSPHLHFGEISPYQVLDAVNRAAHLGGQQGLSRGAEDFTRELVWREFAHHVLFHFPTTPDEPLDPRFRAFPWRRDTENWLSAWQHGRTGFPIIDAGMRQLWRSGYMHNRVRMVVASFLVKNLRLPWQLGERWFWDTLVDADLANNTLGWQWAAGCGADAAPYFRIFNPVRQGERFDAEGRYVRHWVPELAKLPAKFIHKPWQAPEGVLASADIRLGTDYPRPLVDLAHTRKEALAAFETLKSQPA